jgi:hypothetical protein
VLILIIGCASVYSAAFGTLLDIFVSGLLVFLDLAHRALGIFVLLCNGLSTFLLWLPKLVSGPSQAVRGVYRFLDSVVGEPLRTNGSLIDVGRHVLNGYADTLTPELKQTLDGIKAELRPCYDKEGWGKCTTTP